MGQLTKRLKLKQRRLQKQLNRPERNLLKETLLSIRNRCKNRELLLIKNSEMFGMLDQLVFLTSSSQCVTIKKLRLFSLRCSRKLLLLTLRFLHKQLKEFTEMQIENQKPLMIIKLLELLPITELPNLSRK